jgi:hypothetical protein
MDREGWGIVRARINRCPGRHDPFNFTRRFPMEEITVYPGDMMAAQTLLLRILEIQPNLLVPEKLDEKAGSETGKFLIALHAELSKLMALSRASALSG